MLFRSPPALPPRVLLYRSLNDPNAKLTELMLAARTARDLGARELILVAPYLCYMRQDMAFSPGEAISQRIIGRFLADLFDTVITVDPHLHRVRELKDAVPARHAIAASAAAIIGRFLKSRFRDALVLGPDEESEQWVRVVADNARWDFAVASKRRLGDRSVEITLPKVNLAGRAVVLVDDVISTGHTAARTAALARAAGAREVHCVATHALFEEGTLRLLREGGIETVWCTDSLNSECSIIPLAPVLAEAAAVFMA